MALRINLPNQITIGRLVLTIAFCVVLAGYDVREHDADAWRLPVAFVLFVVSGLSDILDGYLARKHNQETSFGRMLDPFVDKVLVCGAFIFLAGDGFVDEHGVILSGVTAWMVVVIVGRELLVTGLRGFSEASGKNFAATVYGKVKMLVQSLTVGGLLIWFAWLRGAGDGWVWFLTLCKVFVWITVITTALSALFYLGRAKGILLEQMRA